MLPKSRRYIAPAERPPNAPTKREIDTLTTDHIGGYTKREIMRLIEIHKHYVDFHYEPQNSDGGLIPDDGTDPLYYYQSNLPLVQRLIAQKHTRGDDDDEDEDEDTVSQDIDERLQELRDGVTNNAIVAVEKGKLSKVIRVQRYVALNLQNTVAVMDCMQENEDVFKVTPDERPDGSGSLAAQLEMLQSLLKFRHDQNAQLKKLIQCLYIKMTELFATVERHQPATSASKRNLNRLRNAADAVLNRGGKGSSGGGGGQETSSAGDVDAELLRDLAAENHFLRREQEYLYFRLYGCRPAAPAVEEPKKGAPASPTSNAKSSSPTKSVGPRTTSTLSSSTGALGGSSGPGRAPLAPGGRAPRLTPVEQFLQGPIENHPDFPNFQKAKEKEIRSEMEAIYKSMVESEVARQFVSTTKGADVLKKLTADVDEHKVMIENLHRQVLAIFEPGCAALKACRAFEENEMAWHDTPSIAKAVEKVIAVRGIREFKDDPSPVGKALELLHNQDLDPKVVQFSTSAVEILASELVHLATPIAEDAFERLGLSVGSVVDAVKHVAMKLSGSVFAVVSVLPKSVSQVCGDAAAKMLRLMVPQWVEEALQLYAFSVANKTDSNGAGNAVSLQQRTNAELQQLCAAAKPSRSSPRHRSRGSRDGAPRDLTPLTSPNGEDGSENDDNAEDQSGAAKPDSAAESDAPPASNSGPRPGYTSGQQTPCAAALGATPKPEMVDRESQCEIVKWQPNSARSELSESFLPESVSRRLSVSQRKRGSLTTTPRSARTAGEDHDTQTETVVMRIQASQTDEAWPGTPPGSPGSQPSKRHGSAGLTPAQAVLPLSRPVSALTFVNPVVEDEFGTPRPAIPMSGAIVVASVEAINTLWFECPSVMPALSEAYQALLRDASEIHHGVELRCDDDAFLVAFASNADALAWAISVQVHAMHLPYPASLLAVGCASAVPHPQMLGGPTIDPSPRFASPTQDFDVSLLHRWTLRGFRIKIAIHHGTICHPVGGTSQDVEVGGPALATVAKMGMVAPGASIIASSTFIAALDAEQHQRGDVSLVSGIRFEDWEIMTAPWVAGEGSAHEGSGGGDAAEEQLIRVIPNELKYRHTLLSSLAVEDETGGGNFLAPQQHGTMLQRWSASFAHQIENSTSGKQYTKLAFVLVDFESFEEFPHYNARMIQSTSERLVGEAAQCATRRGGMYCTKNHRSMVATFEDPIAATQFAIELHVVALQFGDYPPELLMIPSCRELYEESALTWRGLRVRTVIHYGGAGYSLRHVVSGQLEYFGPTIMHANEVSAQAPFGCVTCTAALMREIDLFMDTLEDPVVVPNTEATGDHKYLLPTLLRGRSTYIQAEAIKPHQSMFPQSELQQNAFEQKRLLPEYGSGLASDRGDNQQQQRSPVRGVVAVTHHGIIALWKDEEHERAKFNLRVQAAINAAAEAGKTPKLPTRRDCQMDIIQLAKHCSDVLHELCVKQHAGLLASESSAAFLTTTFVFRSPGEALLCAMAIQRDFGRLVEAAIPPHLVDRIERVYSAETSQLIMGGIRVGTAVHCGPVHFMSTNGCRRTAYHGASIQQAAILSHAYACAGETIVSSRAVNHVKAFCGPSDLGGYTPDEFLSDVVVARPLELPPLPEEEPHDDAAADAAAATCMLLGDSKPSTLLSVLPIEHAERAGYFMRRRLEAGRPHSEQPQQRVDRHYEEIRLQRNLRSKFGFVPLRALAAGKGVHDGNTAAFSSFEPKQEERPAYLWNAVLTQRLYRLVCRASNKASRVMGYPVPTDADPASVDTSLRESIIQASFLAASYNSGSDDVDAMQVAEMRTVLDDLCAELLQRMERNVSDVLVALGARLDRPPAMHRSAQSVIMVPPNEKDESSIFRGSTEVGAGGGALRVALSRPASRELGGSPLLSPLGTTSAFQPGGSSAVAPPFASHSVASASTTPMQGYPAMVSTGTENPRFFSAGSSRRPNSRQSRLSTPTIKVEQGTQLTPADVGTLVAMVLPGAAAQQWGGDTKGSYRFGTGVDVATMRLKERRIMELERRVEELTEHVETLKRGGNPVVAALQHAAVCGESNERAMALLGGTAALDAMTSALLDKYRTKPLSLPPLGGELAPPHQSHHSWNALSERGRDRQTADARRSSTPSRGASAADDEFPMPRDDDGVDFGMSMPSRVGRSSASRGDWQDQTAGSSAALHNASTTANNNAAVLSNALALLQQQETRHFAPSRQQHWRQPSPLAPLQSSFETTFHEGFLVSGEVTSKLSLAAPFCALPKRGGSKTPLPIVPRKQKKSASVSGSGAATAGRTKSLPSSNDVHDVPCRPSSAATLDDTSAAVHDPQ